MANSSPEDFIEWTQPADSELVGWVDSEEAFKKLREEVTSGRQHWLLDSFRSRIAELEKNEAPEPVLSSEDMFQGTPLKSILTYDQHKVLVGMDVLKKWSYESKAEQLRMWRMLAEFEAVRQGFTMDSSKYAAETQMYADAVEEGYFSLRLKSSQELTATHFPIRVLMEGVPYVMAGALDLNTVQQWLDHRDDEKTGYPPVYQTPRGYWPTVIEAKNTWDEEMDYTTYADVVETLADGIFFAPYLPEELVASGHFITLDNVRRSLVLHGHAHKASTTETFNLLLNCGSDDEKTNTEIWRRASYRAQPTYSKSGVVFFETARLPGLVEKLYDYDGKITKTRQYASFVLKDYFPDLVVTDDEREAEKLLFGRSIKEGRFVSSYHALANPPTESRLIPLYNPHALPRAASPIPKQKPEKAPTPKISKEPLKEVATQTSRIDQPPVQNSVVTLLTEQIGHLLNQMTEQSQQHLERELGTLDLLHESETALADARHIHRVIEAKKAYSERQAEREQKRVQEIMKALGRLLTPEELRNLQLLVGYRPE